MNNKNNFNIDFVGLYLFPTLSSISIWILLDGSLTTLIGYSLNIFESRGIAVFILLLLCIDIFQVFHTISKKLNGKNKVKEIVILICKSKSFYCWLLSIANVLFIIIYRLYFLFIIYLVILIACYIFQVELVRKIKEILQREN